MDLEAVARRLLRALDTNHDGHLSVEECSNLKEGTWLFASEDDFEMLVESQFLDADRLWSLISDRLAADPEGAEAWLRQQYRLLRRRQHDGVEVSKSMTNERWWKMGASRSICWSKSLAASGTLQSLWENFCMALQVDEIQSSFSSLARQLAGKGGLWDIYQGLVERLHICIPRFEKQMSDELAGKSVAVVGAGPIGLRLALEASLMGAQVHVFDLRASFTRMNILKLWDWASQDLLELGAKHLLPNFLSYVDHIGIRELQALLMKLCLLLKVRFHWQSVFQVEALRPSAKGLELVVRKESEVVEQVSTVVACDGAKSAVAAFLKLRRVRADGREDAPREELAVVINFQNHGEQEDRLLEECPRGFNSELGLVKRLIYLQGETHYFIMTVTPEVLVEHQVLPSAQEEPVNEEKLEAFAREVVELYSQEVRRLHESGGGIFGVDIAADFWTRRSVALDPKGRKAMSLFAYHRDLTWLEQPMYLLGEQPIFFAGDALREPFWPMGEGCSRGFMGAFDTLWALRCWARGLGGEALLRQRRKLFDLASQVDPQNFGKGVLHPHDRPVPWQGLEFLRALHLPWPSWGFDGRRRPVDYLFTVDPHTRYIAYKDEDPLLCGLCS